MFNLVRRQDVAQKPYVRELEAKVSAIMRSQAVIEFDLEGRIITANENFLSTVGYTLEEVQGRHHSMFVDRDHAASAEYRQLNAGIDLVAHFDEQGRLSQLTGQLGQG